MTAQTLGKYELIEALGSGATADVYRAHDTMLEREVALKILKPSLVVDASAFRRFMQEARSAANLFHPNIATILDMGDAGGRYFIAMRYYPGQSLDKIVKEQKTLSWEETLHMVQQIGAALDYAHQEGFLHRDVKPSNILYTPDGNFILTDFGLIRAIMGSGQTTHTGAILGTPAYIAPEVWKGETISSATDQYALACVVYETLLGTPLFAGETPPAIMTRHVLKGAELPAAWPEDVPGGFTEIMLKALAREPGERYPRIGALVSALNDLAKESRKRQDAIESARRQAEDAARREAEARLAELRNAQSRYDYVALEILLNGLPSDQPEADRFRDWAQNERKFAERLKQAQEAYDFKTVLECLEQKNADYPQRQELLQWAKQQGSLIQQIDAAHKTCQYQQVADLLKGVPDSYSEKASLLAWAKDGVDLFREIKAVQDVYDLERMAQILEEIPTEHPEKKSLKEWLKSESGRYRHIELARADYDLLALERLLKAAPAKAPQITAQKEWLHQQQELSRQVEAARAAFDGEETLKLLEQAPAQYPQRTDLQAWAVQQVEAKRNLHSAMEAVDLEAVEKLLNAMPQAYPERQKVSDWLAAERERQARQQKLVLLLAQAKQSFQNKKWDETIQQCDLALQIQGASDEFRQLIQQAKHAQHTEQTAQDASTAAQNALQERNYPLALQRAAQAVNAAPNNAAYSALLDEVKTKALNQAQALDAEKQWKHTLLIWEALESAGIKTEQTRQGKQFARRQIARQRWSWSAVGLVGLAVLAGILWMGKSLFTAQIPTLTTAANVVAEAQTPMPVVPTSAPATDTPEATTITPTAAPTEQSISPSTPIPTMSLPEPATVTAQKEATVMPEALLPTARFWPSANITFENVALMRQLYQWNPAAVHTLTLSKDGTRMAVASAFGAYVYDTQNSTVLYFCETGSWVYGLAFSPDQKYLAVSASDGKIRLWRLSDWSLENTFAGHQSKINSIAFSPDGQLLASGAADGTIKLWPMNDRVNSRDLQGHANWISSLAFSPDGTYLASASWDGTIRIWDMGSEQILHDLQQTGRVNSIVFSPDGSQLVTGSSDGSIQFRQVRDGQVVQTIQAHEGWVNSLAFSDDGVLLASGGMDNLAHIWQVSDGTLLQTLEKHTDQINGVTFYANGKTLITSSSDDTIRFWRVSNAWLLDTLTLKGQKGYGGMWSGFAPVFTHDGIALAAAGSDAIGLKLVWMWQLSDGVLLHSYRGQPSNINSIAISPDDATIAAGTDTHIYLWNTVEETLKNTLITNNPSGGGAEKINGVVYDPQEPVLTSGGASVFVRSWNTDSGELLNKIGELDSYTNALALSPDGKLVALALVNDIIEVWQRDGEKRVLSLRGHKDDVTSVAFSPDGQMLASGSRDKTIRLWRIGDGVMLQMLEGHTDGIEALCFSPNGQILASGSRDRTIKLWRIEDGVLLHTLYGNQGMIKHLTFSPDGYLLASGSTDLIVRLWGVP